jgi:hypothetical protein
MMRRAQWVMALLACVVAAPVAAWAQDVFKPEAGKGWWVFDPPHDTFSPQSLLDLRHLNEDVAGEHRFIRLSPDGESFVRGDGQPIRFWGGTVSPDASHADLDDHARFLAKRGVNMVRWHGHLAPTNNPNSLITDVNEQALDGLFYFVAAMKKQGIYVTVSPYYALSDHMLDDKGQATYPRWTVPHDARAQTTMGLLFFEPELQTAYKGWIRAMLTRVNPYTGLALKDDPAVAIFQIQNEDSLLFWTFNNVRGGDRDVIEKAFGDWLIRKYGSLDAAQKAWDGAEAVAAITSDRPASGMMALPNLAELGKSMDETTGLARRYRDSTEFLTGTMRDFNADIVGYVKSLGAKQLVNPGNWRTASQTYLNDAERYSYAAGDIEAVNRYVTGIHEGSDTASWAVAKGERFTSLSTIKDPAEFPLNLKQVSGHPMMVTESLWVSPNAYESEGPFLVSAMSALNGIDLFYWFSLGNGPDWDQPKSANGYLPSIGKFTAGTPMTLGQFPAAALMYREGDVAAAAQPAVFEHRTLDDLWNRRKPLIEEESGFDPNRDASQPAPGTASPLAYLVGPVKVDYGVGKANAVMSLTPFVDAQTATVTSETRQIRWNFGAGVVQVDSNKAQGVTGFLKDGGGTFALKDVTITSTNDYAAITVVSLDGAPITTSRKLLIQTGTQARPSGWADEALSWTQKDGTMIKGRRIDEPGHAPWLVADTQGSVIINNASLSKATALDGNGLPVAPAATTRTGGTLTVTLPRDSLYVIVQ